MILQGISDAIEYSLENFQLPSLITNAKKLGLGPSDIARRPKKKPAIKRAFNNLPGKVKQALQLTWLQQQQERQLEQQARNRSKAGCNRNHDRRSCCSCSGNR